MRHLRLAVPVLVVLFATALAGYAGDRGEGWETLRRLKYMRVAVNELPPEAAELGLTKERLKGLIELRLRGVGIKVPAGPGSYVVVTVSTLHVAEAGSYAADVLLELKQLVFLEPWPSAPGQYLPTWHTSRLRLVPASDYVDGVENALKECLEDFIGDWLAADDGY